MLASSLVNIRNLAMRIIEDSGFVGITGARGETLVSKISTTYT